MTVIAIVHEYFDALGRGDLDRVGELIDPDVVWHQPGNNQFSGTKKGRDAVFEMIGKMMEISGGTFKIDKVDAILANGDLVAAPIHFVAVKAKAAMSMAGVDVMRIVDGKLAEVWLFSGDQPTEDAFWG